MKFGPNSNENGSKLERLAKQKQTRGLFNRSQTKRIKNREKDYLQEQKRKNELEIKYT